MIEDQRYGLALSGPLPRIRAPVEAISPPVMFRDHATLRHLDPALVRRDGPGALP